MSSSLEINMVTLLIEILFIVSLVAPPLAVVLGGILLLAPRPAKYARTREPRAGGLGIASHP